jgi:hypothetical protein
MYSVKNMLFALTGDDPMSFRAAARAGTRPALTQTGEPFSLLEWCHRYSAAGRELRDMANGSKAVWGNVHRATVVTEARERLRNPMIMQQDQTSLCGPMAVIMNLARRQPGNYVKAVAEILRDGVYHARGDKVFSAEVELRGQPVPANMAQIDWMFAATMRDSENAVLDVEDGQGLEGLTMPGEMQDWLGSVIGLDSNFISCFHEGEMEALTRGQKAIDAGGIAILLIDVNMIKDGKDDHEEVMQWRAAGYDGATRRDWGSWHHPKDDALPPDHYVVLFDASKMGQQGVEVRLWSWGQEFQIQASRKGFSEYLYGVVTGVPR